MQQQTPRTFTLKDFFFAPFGCLFSLSPYIVPGALIIAVLVGGLLYFETNNNPFGLGEPDFGKYQLDAYWKDIRLEDRRWSITYELAVNSNFNGKVRHVTPIREGQFPFLTHDILVTSGDFSDPDKVYTSVNNHHFFWQSFTTAHPVGTLNLLHTVTFNQAIYDQLMLVRNDQMVKISGREILKIDALDDAGQTRMGWQDTGCNTLLVTQIEIIQTP